MAGAGLPVASVGEPGIYHYIIVARLACPEKTPKRFEYKEYLYLDTVL